ncbi:hypothetical protein NU219Hw_g3235t1 [Hortaea werneckii]
MLLLNARTYALKFFHTPKTAPPYAILSHTWEDDEVLFKDMDDLEKAKAKSGWQKIEYVCRQALEDGLEWAWVDTCCIDKSSSAELSEAINSMFKWYECSTVCYVYLCDVAITAAIRDDAPMVSKWRVPARKVSVFGSLLSENSEDLWKYHVAGIEEATSDIISAMRNEDEGRSLLVNELDISLIDTLRAFSTARWWSRGWTLQELLAPRDVVFMDQEWQQIARLPELVVTVSTISSVSVEVLLKVAPLQSRCIAERLSWASNRSTTREEDTAYALLGIFDTNMPLLYGEGSRAFQRLQEVISLSSNDLSIYAWRSVRHGFNRPMFATAPSYFAGLSAVRTRFLGPITGSSVSFMGVTITSVVYRKHGHYYIDLGCYYMLTPNLPIMLRCVAELVPDLPLNEACTQSFSPLHMPNSSLTDMALSEHPDHSQNANRLVVGVRHLTVEVVRAKDEFFTSRVIMFDIHIHATPITGNRDTVRFPWPKRRKDQSRSDEE